MKFIGADLHKKTISLCVMMVVEGKREVVTRRRFECSDTTSIRRFFEQCGGFQVVVEATANGYFTAASGQAIYRADRFPPEFHGNHFSVDNAQNLIHRCLLEPSGCMYAAKRPVGEEQTEFLTSTDAWFRPVNLETGPDGTLYVVDMYRAIIEDYSAIPRYLQQLYVESLIAGGNRGRIWRIVAKGARRPRKVDVAEAPADRLVSELSNPIFDILNIYT